MDAVELIEHRITQLRNQIERPHTTLQKRCDLQAQITALDAQARILTARQREECA